MRVPVYKVTAIGDAALAETFSITYRVPQVSKFLCESNPAGCIKLRSKMEALTILTTPRLHLIPATAALVRAEMDPDKTMLAAMLGATVPDNYPPEAAVDALPWFLQQLEAHPEWSGWLNWYALLTLPEQELPVLVGCGGFLGPPKDGSVEVGYSMLPQFQGRGVATEMVGRLVHWALEQPGVEQPGVEQPGVEQVVAEALSDNAASLRVLEKLGFKESGVGSEPGLIRLALSVPASP